MLYSQVGIRINVTEFHLPDSGKILKTDRKHSRDDAELRRLPLKVVDVEAPLFRATIKQSH